jgi:aspartate kinase
VDVLHGNVNFGLAWANTVVNITQSFEIDKIRVMKVFKFGGASVKSSNAIKNVGEIVKKWSSSQLLIIVSAMGKTTNALERIVSLGQNSKDFTDELDAIKTYHNHTVTELGLTNTLLLTELEKVYTQLTFDAERIGNFDEIYDQVVAQGEVLSSLILSHYLQSIDIETEWIDARKYIITDDAWREGKVNWEKTKQAAQHLNTVLNNKKIVTQGFIGATEGGKTTTLGREGSDYSAAIFASCLQAKSVTIWKDVPGVMSADPKRIPTATVFEELPYQEAAEMTYYGASVIHPKTIKPLANAKIPLLVKNFDNPSLPGTRIHECKVESLPPLIVFKENQCLISCKVTDYTFISEEQIGIIFQALMHHNVRINVMQNSAISFSFCVDFRDTKIMNLIHELGNHFEVYYNTNLTLITIKNYDAASYNEYRSRPGLLLEQSSRSTLQVLIKG